MANISVTVHLLVLMIWSSNTVSWFFFRVQRETVARKERGWVECRLKVVRKLFISYQLHQHMQFPNNLLVIIIYLEFTVYLNRWKECVCRIICHRSCDLFEDFFRTEATRARSQVLQSSVWAYLFFH